MTDRVQEILRDNLVECLKISDRTIITSIFVLFVGAVTASNGSDNGTAVLPIVNVSIGSPNTALWLILGIHVVNGLRYVFLLLRAAAVARRLEKHLLEATRFFPAVATNNVIAEATVGLLMVGLSIPISEQLYPDSFWMGLVVALGVILPFIAGNVATIRYLNA